MGVHSNENFASLAAQILSNGYSVIPIMPGTKDVPKSELNWHRFSWKPLRPEELASFRNRFPDHSIGIACGFHCIAVDIDSDHEPTAQALLLAAETTLSRTPLLRVGRTPRVILIYGCAEPIVSYHLPPSLEILGIGRYFVAFGKHPVTRRCYRWDRENSPRDTPTSALPQVTQSRVDSYIKAVCPILGINYDDVAFDIDRKGIVRVLSSRSGLFRQLVQAVLFGKTSAQERAARIAADNCCWVPMFRDLHRK